jgi:hypothetical protein
MNNALKTEELPATELSELIQAARQVYEAETSFANRLDLELERVESGGPASAIQVVSR